MPDPEEPLRHDVQGLLLSPLLAPQIAGLLEPVDVGTNGLRRHAGFAGEFAWRTPLRHQGHGFEQLALLLGYVLHAVLIEGRKAVQQQIEFVPHVAHRPAGKKLVEDDAQPGVASREVIEGAQPGPVCLEILLERFVLFEGGEFAQHLFLLGRRELAEDLDTEELEERLVGIGHRAQVCRRTAQEHEPLFLSENLAQQVEFGSSAHLPL